MTNVFELSDIFLSSQTSHFFKEPHPQWISIFCNIVIKTFTQVLSKADK